MAFGCPDSNIINIVKGPTFADRNYVMQFIAYTTTDMFGFTREW